MSDGLGVMISKLFGRGETVALYQRAIGQTVARAEFVRNGDCIRLEMADGLVFEVFDDGQSCCEHRYMTCDDDLGVLVGGKLTRIDVDPADDIEDGAGDVHEVQFLRIETDNGGITAETHNKHNGYYGGFSIALREVPHD